MPKIRPAANAKNRGLNMTPEGTLVINHHGSSAPLYEIVPTMALTMPCIMVFDVSAGREEGKRRLLMTLGADGPNSGASWLHHFLPTLIQTARTHPVQLDQYPSTDGS